MKNTFNRRNRNNCVIYIYYVLGLVLMWLTYATLETTNPAKRQRIFFVETSEPQDGILDLVPRQVCAIESASRANPNTIIELYISNVNELKAWQRTNKLWKIILDLPNVNLKFINYTKFMSDTPLQHIFESGGLKSKAEWITWHKSDLLRFAILWKTAGTYLDLDIISMRGLESLGNDWVVHQRPTEITPLMLAGGSMKFSRNVAGRQLISSIVNDLAAGFTGESWDDSSVGVLTRTVVKWCKKSPITGENLQNCNGLKIWPSNIFYPITWENQYYFFEEANFNEAIKLIDKAVGVHLWNYSTQKESVMKDKKTLLNELAIRYCPTLFETVDLYL